MFGMTIEQDKFKAKNSGRVGFTGQWARLKGKGAAQEN